MVVEYGHGVKHHHDGSDSGIGDHDRNLLYTMMRVGGALGGDDVGFWVISQLNVDGFCFNMGHFEACDYRHIQKDRKDRKPEKPERGRLGF